MTTSSDRPSGIPEPGQLIGAAIERVEDEAFLRGAGCFTDDLQPDGAAHAMVVRSPFAHAQIEGINRGLAAAMPGVLTILTAADLAGEVAVVGLATPPAAVKLQLM